MFWQPPLDEDFNKKNKQTCLLLKSERAKLSEINASLQFSEEYLIDVNNNFKRRKY